MHSSQTSVTLGVYNVHRRNVGPQEVLTEVKIKFAALLDFYFRGKKLGTHHGCNTTRVGTVYISSCYRAPLTPKFSIIESSGRQRY
jgi:hypothetical protein